MLYLLLLLTLGCANYSKVPSNVSTKVLDDDTKDRIAKFKAYVRNGQDKECLKFLGEEAEGNRLGVTFGIDAECGRTTDQGNYALFALIFWGLDKGKDNVEGREKVLDYLVGFMSNNTLKSNRLDHSTMVGADVNLVMLISAKCSTSLLEKLLTTVEKVDLNIALDGNLSPIVFAASRASSDSDGPRRMELILNIDYMTGNKIHTNRGIDPDVELKGGVGVTAFMLAAHIGDVEILKRMVKAKPSLTKKDIDKFNAIIYALMCGNAENRYRAVSYLAAVGVPYTTLGDIVKETLRKIIVASVLAFAGGAVEQAGAAVGGTIITGPIGNFVSMSAKKALAISPSEQVRRNSKSSIALMLSSGKWVEYVDQSTITSLNKLIAAAKIQINHARKIVVDCGVNKAASDASLVDLAQAVINDLEKYKTVVNRVIGTKKTGNINIDVFIAFKKEFADISGRFNNYWEKYIELKKEKRAGSDDSTQTLEYTLEVKTTTVHVLDMIGKTQIWNMQFDDQDTMNSVGDFLASVREQQGSAYRLPSGLEVRALINGNHVPNEFYISSEFLSGMDDKFRIAYNKTDAQQVDAEDKGCSFFFVRGEK